MLRILMDAYPIIISPAAATAGSMEINREDQLLLTFCKLLSLDLHLCPYYMGLCLSDDG